MSLKNNDILEIMSRTYLEHCQREDMLCRWPDSAMPIGVYIAPFTWYEKKKQQQAYMYRQMVLSALDIWRKATNGLVRFNVVDNLNQSQIDIKWRRVDRKTLGHCTYEMDNQNRMFSAEVQIGISDGLVHAAYNDTGEVMHTILHEIGHALGLIGHSDHPDDIMYVPHQYGVHSLSARDVETITWLYQLPVSFNYQIVGKKYFKKPGYSLNDVIDRVERRIKGEAEPEEAEASPIIKPADAPSPVGPPPKRTASLDEQHEILSEMGRFYLKTQSVRLDPGKQNLLRHMMIQKNMQHKFRPPHHK